MARTDTLPHFLTDVADAIREKKGTEETIQASDFDTEIENLPSGGGASDYINTTIDFNPTPHYNSGLAPKMLKYAKGLSVSSSVNTLTYAFNKCSNLTEISFSSDSDVSNVTSFENFASNCINLTKVVFAENKPFTNLTTLNQAFNYDSALINVNFNQTSATNVSNIGFAFNSCSNLETLDLSTLSGTLQWINGAFSGCSKLMFLDVRGFVFSGASNYSNAFTSVPNNCEIIVKDDTEKSWINTNFSNLINVKTVAEYEAEQNA